MIRIWQPRWHDRVVLIAKYKVRYGDNVIKFTKSKSLKEDYHILGEEIIKYPTESNGKIDCYAVPLEKMVCIKNTNATTSAKI
jgi:hypothetical protein